MTRKSNHSKSFSEASARRRHPSSARLKDRCPIDNKIRYRDHREAVEALHRSKNVGSTALFITGETTRKEKRTYSCGYCKGWHLTSQEQRTGIKVAA